MILSRNMAIRCVKSNWDPVVVHTRVLPNLLKIEGAYKVNFVQDKNFMTAKDRVTVINWMLEVSNNFSYLLCHMRHLV